MTSDPRTVAYIVEQAAAAGAISARPMFGEYGLFCDGKMVAIVGEDRLFVKATAVGRTHAVGCEEESPYPGAKPCLVIDPERWDDRDWLGELLRVTAAELPLPKPRQRKQEQAMKIADTSTDATLDGGCRCGRLRYRVVGKPQAVNCCHCRDCQRLTGSAFAVNAVYQTAQVELRGSCWTELAVEVDPDLRGRLGTCSRSAQARAAGVDVGLIC